MKKIIACFLALILFFSSLIPVFQNSFSPQKVYAETCIYYLEDGLGNVRFITSRSGTNVRSYTYDPFGNITGTQGTLTGNRYQFQTQQNDSESGMYYLRARYYDPTTGRFISRDPVKGTLVNPQTQNPYAYAGNNPVNISDPSGKWWGPFSIDSIHNDWNNCQYGTAIAKTGVVAVGTGLAAAGVVAAGVYVVGAVGATEVAVGTTAIAGKITGYTKHGINQAIGRDEGIGVSPNAILDAISNPAQIIKQADGSIKYIGNMATVILNNAGKVITTWANSGEGIRGQ
ncbi:RHS repeat-associated core domain-containing protein [Patescibacteria group bacterium]|nr:RHS repeat-associated core domain-containing protein [Patescibacteria group bacterium]MBU4016974.1 RHS repeat-associated core domain-containing protein [Patescibacteria group bacterium]MBU4099403.1 RHS repeat-associated core domain-containing protein [Patescibacteria group bacterium]